MLAMQRLQPEMKKLQAKYKGPENRELLNQEMMRLYKENGTSPFGACLPSLLQMPFLIVLYSLIRGLSTTTATKVVNGHKVMRWGPEIHPHELANAPGISSQSRANALVVRDGFVVASILKSHDQSVYACGGHDRKSGSSRDPLPGSHCGCDVPAVLPNEADEQPQSAGCCGQSTDANNAEVLPYYFRCHLPKSARWSNHLHGGVFGHADRNPGDDVPHRHGHAGGGRARDRLRQGGEGEGETQAQTGRLCQKKSTATDGTASAKATLAAGPAGGRQWVQRSFGRQRQEAERREHGEEGDERQGRRRRASRTRRHRSRIPGRARSGQERLDSAWSGSRWRARPSRRRPSRHWTSSGWPTVMPR